MDKKRKKNIKIPHKPSEEPVYYEIESLEEKIVADYTGFNFTEVDELNVITFWQLLKDAVVYNYSQTQSGREYLADCWRLEQTSPERDKLRAHFGGEANGKVAQRHNN